jgi:hypothetical protein
MTESQIISALKSAAGGEYDVNVYKRDMTGRIGSHSATFVIQVSDGEESTVINGIRSLDIYEMAGLFETQLSSDSQIPLVYIFITFDCTF